MPDEAASTGGAIPAEVRDAAADLIRNAEITDIRAVRIVGELADPATPPRTDALTTTFEIGVAYACDVGVFGNKFDYRFVLADPNDVNVATIEFSLVVDYRVDPTYAPLPAAADFVTTSTGYFAAYPFARELLESMTARLGLSPLVLGMLPHGALSPRSITARPAAALASEPNGGEATQG